jgi:hypothetical protein
VEEGIVVNYEAIERMSLSCRRWEKSRLSDSRHQISVVAVAREIRLDHLRINGLAWQD